MAAEQVNSIVDVKPGTDILYVSSVPVTLLYSGAAFMFRLFEGIEKRLVVFQGIRLNENTQLKHINYEYYEPAFKRLQYSRFKELYFLLNIARDYFFIPAKLQQIVKEQQPKVIITVSNGLLWILAYRLAKKNNLPLVILVHDDLNAYFTQKHLSGKIIHRLFRKVYREAKLRFCISGLMKERYDALYKVPAEVLYPLQGKQEIFDAKETGTLHQRFTIAYAGSLDTGPYIDMIIKLANELEKVNGIVIIFSNVFPAQLAAVKNISNRGFLTPDQLQQQLITEADALFVPFPFYANDLHVELAFPSKIADYTLIRKPLLIWAPPNCALSRWFRSLPVRIGVLVETMLAEELNRAVKNLAEPSNNSIWGENSFNMGQQYFNNEKQQHFFYSKIEEVVG